MINICFLVGGSSLEHDFSFKSLSYILKYIKKSQQRYFEIRKIVYLTPTFACYEYDIDIYDLNAELSADFLIKHGKLLEFSLLAHKIYSEHLFLFSLIQGQYGEDGHLQALGHLLNINSNLDHVFGAAVAANKWCQNIVAEALCLDELSPIPSSLVSCDINEEESSKILAKWQNKKCILKPNSLGGSFLVKAYDSFKANDLFYYINEIKKYDHYFLIQDSIYGREIACSCIIKDGQVLLLPTLQVNQMGALMDYDEKHYINKYHWDFVKLNNDIRAKLEIVCSKLATYYQFNTYFRCDFIVNDNIYLLEINNVPSIYENSVFNRALIKANLNIVELIYLTYKNYNNKKINNHKNCDNLIG